MLRIATIALVLTATACQPAQQPSKQAETSKTGRYQMVGGGEGAVWKLDTENGNLSHCEQASAPADKEGWQDVKITCGEAQNRP